MRICLVYDCLFPYTVGGAERWYRNLGERLAAEGHEVTYLTLRQWKPGERAEVPGVRVVTAGPRMELYAEGGRRRILPPLVFGAGVLWHLLRHGGRYDVVHTASFPYFSLLAAALVRPLRRFRLVVDWHELWSRELLARVPRAGRRPRGKSRCRHSACGCPSAPSASRAFTSGGCATAHVNGELDRARGRVRGLARAARARGRASRWSCSPGATSRRSGCRRSCRRSPWRASGSRSCAARSSATAPSATRCCGCAPRTASTDVLDVPGLRGRRAGRGTRWRARSAWCSRRRREGYGMVVVEAAAALGTPSVVVAGEDNAATDLVERGRERLRRAVRVAGGPRRGDRARARARATRCASAPRRGSAPTRSACRSRARSRRCSTSYRAASARR